MLGVISFYFVLIFSVVMQSCMENSRQKFVPQVMAGKEVSVLGQHDRFNSQLGYEVFS